MELKSEGSNSGSFPAGERSHQSTLSSEAAIVPVIDMTSLRSNDSNQRYVAIQEIRNACISLGFFQIINHGISQTVIDDAIAQANEFFNLPVDEKMKYKSDDVCRPIRYETGMKDGVDKIKFSRAFLKHYANPLQEWIGSWPSNPPSYKEKMGKYSTEARKVSLELMEAITESMGLNPTYLSKKMAEGVQVLAVNYYPPCAQPEIAHGLPPHSDYSCITALLQSCQGLEIMADGSWKLVPNLQNALQIHVGDHLEVLSNGLYKSVIHRVRVNSERTRISLASLHSMGMYEKMETAEVLVNEQNPKKYKESSFNDFLKFLSKNDLSEGKRFISTLEIKKECSHSGHGGLV